MTYSPGDAVKVSQRHDFFWSKTQSPLCLLLTHLRHQRGPPQFSGSDRQTQFGGSSYRNCRPGKSQAEQHEERNSLLGGFDVRHAEAAVIAAESRVRRLEDIREFEEIQADHGWRQNRQLRGRHTEERVILPHTSQNPNIAEWETSVFSPRCYHFLPVSELKSSISIVASAFKTHLQFAHLGRQAAMSPCFHSPSLLECSYLVFHFCSYPPTPPISTHHPKGPSDNIVEESCPTLPTPVVPTLARMSLRGMPVSAWPGPSFTFFRLHVPSLYQSAAPCPLQSSALCSFLYQDTIDT